MTQPIASNPGRVTVVLFHHALGLTEGIDDLAATFAQAGYPTVVPDLYEGKTFDDVHAGVNYAGELGQETLIQRGRAAVAELQHPVVFVGISMGTMLAQYFAQGDDRSVGAVLVAGATDPSRFDTHWPDSVNGQLHRVEGDPWEEGEEVHALVSAVPDLEVFTYADVGHLFVDSSLDDYDASACSQFTNRALTFLLNHSAGTEGSTARDS